MKKEISYTVNKAWLQKILLHPENHPGTEQLATGDCVMRVYQGIQRLVTNMNLSSIHFIYTLDNMTE